MNPGSRPWRRWLGVERERTRWQRARDNLLNRSRRLFFTVRHSPSQARDVIQRARRGYGDGDAFDLDQYLAGVIAGSVASLRQRSIGYPNPLTHEEWDDVLARIVAGFDARRRSGAILDAISDPAECATEEARLDALTGEALELFAEYFDALWI